MTKPSVAGPGRKPKSDVPDLFAAVYPRAVKGKFRQLKWGAVSLLLAIYYIVPWLRWDRGPDAPSQAVLVDIGRARAYLFGLEIWPQEVYYLTGLMILAAIGLFMMTALFGRLWCGYACPQTVWTDIFLAIERRIEGDRNARMKLEHSPWTPGKIVKKAAKHAAWLMVSLLTGGAFVLYFVDAPTTLPPLASGDAGSMVYWSVCILTGTTYLLAGWAREQVCTYMCPWPRIQAAMLDEHSIIVSYDAQRGESRGHAKVGQSFEGRGHCVNCSLCVQVCPTGIDIRNGLQMACIGCGLCIDACNGVMARFDLPKNLIGWSSLAQRAAPPSVPAKHRFFRPVIFAYAGCIALVALLMAVGLTQRSMIGINVIHDRSPLLVRLSGGIVRNGFTLNLLNKDLQPHELVLTVGGLEGAILTVIGTEATGSSVRLTVRPDTVDTYRLLVSDAVRPGDPPSLPITLEVRDPLSGATAERSTVFMTSETD